MRRVHAHSGLRWNGRDKLSRCFGIKKRILIVDDDEMTVAILRRVLGSVYEIGAAADGQAGLDMMRSFGPDLVLMDIMMPGIDGY